MQRKTHPIVFIAAASLIFFSLAGGAALLGYQPLAQTQAANGNGCASGKLFDNSLTNNTSGAVNGTVIDSKESYQSEMPAIGNAANNNRPFDVLITKS